MHEESMGPYGSALLAYFEGDTDAELIIRRDDGLEGKLPVSFFFRTPAEFRPVDAAAMDNVRGHVLDVGAGTGLHSLAMQERGMRVTAIDIDPRAVAVMQRRGVKDARCADIFQFRESGYDTILLLDHGIGLAETITGLDRFLALARTLIAPGGQIVLDSLDVQVSDDPRHVAYLEANVRAGRYRGEIRIQTEFRGQKGPYCGWLQVDPQTLAKHAATAGWKCEIILQEKSGDYLAKLS